MNEVHDPVEVTMPRSTINRRKLFLLLIALVVGMDAFLVLGHLLSSHADEWFALVATYSAFAFSVSIVYKGLARSLLFETWTWRTRTYLALAFIAAIYTFISIAIATASQHSTSVSPTAISPSQSPPMDADSHPD